MGCNALLLLSTWSPNPKGNEPWMFIGRNIFPISWSLLKFMSIELVVLSNHLILCHPLLLLPSIFPSIRVFSMSQLFAPGGQSIEASASVLPMNIQGSFPLRLTGLISLLSKGLWTFFSNTIVQKHQFFSAQLSLLCNHHIRVWLLGKPQLWLCEPWDKWGQRKNREFAITLFPGSQGPAIWLLLSVFQSLMFVFYIKAKVFSCTWQEKIGKTTSTPSSQKQKSVIEFLKNQVGTKLLLWLALKTKVGFGKWRRQNKLIFSITFTKMIDLTNSKPVFYFQIKLKFAVKIATDMQIIKYKTRDFLT